MQATAERRQTTRLVWHTESRHVQVCRTAEGREVGHVSVWLHGEWLAYVRGTMSHVAVGSLAVCRAAVEQAAREG